MWSISVFLIDVNDFLDEPVTHDINLIEVHKADATDLLEDGFLTSTVTSVTGVLEWDFWEN